MFNIDLLCLSRSLGSLFLLTPLCCFFLSLNQLSTLSFCYLPPILMYSSINSCFIFIRPATVVLGGCTDSLHLGFPLSHLTVALQTHSPNNILSSEESFCVYPRLQKRKKNHCGIRSSMQLRKTKVRGNKASHTHMMADKQVQHHDQTQFRTYTKHSKVLNCQYISVLTGAL